MIYKLFNYLSSVSVVTEHGIEYLRHNGSYYENEQTCIEIKEVAHNEIQVTIKRTLIPIDKINLEFINPMESVKAQLNMTGEVLPYQEGFKDNQCFTCSDLGVYALGIEKDHENQASFLVTPHYILVELTPVKTADHYRLVFEKYLKVHSNKEIVSRFNHLLEEAVSH